MRVGVYIDGFNLYYGARGICGRGKPGWRWLDIRSLATTLVARRHSWAGAHIDRIVYCTARIDATTDPTDHAHQDLYLKALAGTRSIDHIEYGFYVSRVRHSPLATMDRNGRPLLVRPQWPLMVCDASGNEMPDAVLMVSHARREEKASDVNLASHLLYDMLTGAVEAAVVISNDSDLRLPIRRARQRVPVGVVNPTQGVTAGSLRAGFRDGVGRHWWYQLNAADITGHQLPDPAAGHARPDGW
jgi:uncharacterized LabA/DUF88 family protein